MRLHSKLRLRRKILKDRWRRFWLRQPQVIQICEPLAIGLALGLIATAVAAPFLAKPAMAGYRDWQARRMLTGVEADLKTGNPLAARERALYLLRSGRHADQALPLLARAAIDTGDPKRCDYARMLLSSGMAAPADRLGAWREICRADSAWRMMFSWTQLPSAEQADVDFAAVYLDRLLDEELPAEVEACLRRFPRPLPPALVERDLRRLAAGNHPSSWREFQDVLIEALKRDPAEPATWQKWLDEIPQEQITTSAGQFRMLLKQCGSPAEKLRASRLEMIERPHEAERIFLRAMHAFAAAAPRETAVFCLCINRPGEALGVLRNVDLSRDATSYQLACRAAEQSGDYERWAELLREPPPGPVLAPALCDRVYLNGKFGQTETRKRDEAAAIAAALALPDDAALPNLARRAQMRGLDHFTRRVWLEMIRAGKGRLPMAKRIEPLIRELATKGNEEDLNLVLSAYRSAEPGNLVVFVQTRYLELISERISPALMSNEFEKLLDRVPEVAAVRYPLALAMLLNGREIDALRVTTATGRSPSHTGDSYDAIHALCLYANNRQMEATRLWHALNWETFLPSEKSLFQEKWRYYSRSQDDVTTRD